MVYSLTPLKQLAIKNTTITGSLMPITHVIAHHLSKQIDEEPNLVLRKSELKNDSEQTTLFNTLKSSFNTRISRKHGSFDDEKSYILLAEEINQYLQDESKFKAFTTKFVKKIEELLIEHNGEVNAHFIFFIEAKEKQTVFYLFIVYQNEYLTFNDSLEIMHSYSIDTGSTLCGLKLNIDDWQQRPKYHYLTLVPPKGNDVLSDALHEVSGFGNKIDKAKSTKEFLENVDTFSQQMPEQKQQEFKEKIINYCEEQEAKDEAVHIPTLSKSLEGIDVEKFIKEVLPHNPKRTDDEEEQEILVDKRSLRRYVKFSGRDKDLSLTFSTNQLNSSIFYDERADTLLIQNIPKSLKKQLQAHIKKVNPA